jgi:uncharacterized tellurite resistance protein B-like protein
MGGWGNSLKTLLLRLRAIGNDKGFELTGREWAAVDMYAETPVDAEERKRLVVQLQGLLRTSSHKKLAIEAIHDLMSADGVVTDAERAVLEELETSITEVSVGLPGLFDRLTGGLSRGRQDLVRGAPNRERFFDDYLRNKVYYSLSRHLGRNGMDLGISEEEQRKLGLAGGLMAKVAHIDGELSDNEFKTMVATIRSFWSLDENRASFVAEVALASMNDTYDVSRIMRQLAKSSEPAERCQILTALFAVAAADGEISGVEHEEIRLIARGMLLTHEDFINAKLRVTRRN